MSNEREELAGIIHRNYCLEIVHSEACTYWADDHEAADAVLAAGFRRVTET